MFDVTVASIYHVISHCSTKYSFNHSPDTDAKRSYFKYTYDISHPCSSKFM